MPSDKYGAKGYAEKSDRQFARHHVGLVDREKLYENLGKDGRREFPQCQHIDCGHTPDIASEVDQRNGWRDKGELDEEMQGSAQQQAAHLLYSMLTYITEKGDLDTAIGLSRMTVRTLAFAKVFAPHLLTAKDGSQATLEQLAAPLHRSKEWLSEMMDQVSQRFSFYSSGQKNRRTRANSSQAASQAWRKRKGDPVPAKIEFPAPRARKDNRVKRSA